MNTELIQKKCKEIMEAKGETFCGILSVNAKMIGRGFCADSVVVFWGRNEMGDAVFPVAEFDSKREYLHIICTGSDYQNAVCYLLGYFGTGVKLNNG